MTGIKWGVPLTGAQMKLLRLPEGTEIGYKPEWANCWNTVEIGAWVKLFIPHAEWYRLPATHPAYTLLEKGWLDGRNVRLWFGGKTAPSDWDGGNVLLRCRRIGVGVSWRHFDDNGDIIAYIAKDDVTEQPETVTIAKMTEAEAERLYPHLDLNTLKDLRLIREPTREERFWALHEPEGTTVPTHIKKWVKDALEFEQN